MGRHYAYGRVRSVLCRRCSPDYYPFAPLQMHHRTRACQKDVEVALEGDLSEAQRQRLLAAVGACPVKRMLTGEMAEGLRTTLLPAAAP